MKTLFAHADRPLVFGHRGYASQAPENTMAAFKLCAERGIFGIELDVHRCATGEIVVIHDHTVDRVAGVSGHVEEMSLGALRELEVGSHAGSAFTGERIPLLQEVLETFGDSIHYDIELKMEGTQNTGLAESTWELIQQYHLEHVSLVSSFNPFAIRQFNRVSKKAVPTAVIYSEAEEVPAPLRHGWGRHIARCSVLKPDFQLVTEKSVRKFNLRLGYPLLAWTVDDYAEGKRLIELGVSGLVSNDPGLFSDLIGQR